MFPAAELRVSQQLSSAFFILFTNYLNTIYVPSYVLLQLSFNLKIIVFPVETPNSNVPSHFILLEVLCVIDMCNVMDA